VPERPFRQRSRDEAGRQSIAGNIRSDDRHTLVIVDRAVTRCVSPIQVSFARKLRRTAKLLLGDPARRRAQGRFVLQGCLVLDGIALPCVSNPIGDHGC
jgi:hypothetical protein